MCCGLLTAGQHAAVQTGSYGHVTSTRPVRSSLSCPALCDPMDSSPAGSSVLGDSPGKNTGVGCRALLQGIFWTQGSNLCLSHLLHWQVGTSWQLEFA